MADKCILCDESATQAGFFVYCDLHIEQGYGWASRFKSNKCKNIGDKCYSGSGLKLAEKWMKYSWLQEDEVVYSVSLNGKIKMQNYCAFCRTFGDKQKNINRQEQLKDRIMRYQLQIDKDKAELAELIMNDTFNGELFIIDTSPSYYLNEHVDKKPSKFIGVKRINKFKNKRPSKRQRTETHE